MRLSLQYAILGLLNYKPMTGYELKSVFDNSVNYFWAAQLSQIYRDLSALESKGFVVSRTEVQEGRPDKRVYSITQRGDEAFQEWLNKFPKKVSVAIRDEICLRMFFGHRIQVEELKFQLRKFIKEKQEVVDVLNLIGEHRDCLKGEQNPEEMFFQQLTVKKGLLVFGAEIKWAEGCLKELDELKTRRGHKGKGGHP